MPRTKKRFIDKRTALTFCLVNRSQRDPLVADENAPQKVLVQLGHKKDKVEVEKRREEQRKFGVFYDDDYNYLQHLKEGEDVTVWDPVVYRVSKDVESGSSEETQLRLPSSVFQSSVVENVGMLNKAAPVRGPQVDWDPDVVAALDDDFNFSDPDNELDDDFMVMANAAAASDDEGEYDVAVNERKRVGSDLEDSDDEFDDEQSFTNEETKSQFTNYSLTSSVIRRNEGLTLLDDRFEKFYEMYGDEDIGALDDEDIEGFIDPSSNMMEQILAEYHAKKAKQKLPETVVIGEVPCGMEDNTSDTEDMVVEDTADRWDCESILSTYSNIYNHPRLIKLPPKTNQIVISEKTGFPKHVIGSTKLTARNLEYLDLETESVGGLSTRSRPVTIRLKTETPEEKRTRKLAVRSYRKERRLEKKANTSAFKEERKTQDKLLKNIQQNMQGIKLV